MPFDYTDQAASNSRVLARTGLDASLFTEIDYKLEDSAGVNGTTTYYRPMYVGAVMLMQSRDDQTVTSADGAKFFGDRKQWNLQPVIESLLREQQALDRTLELTIPDGYDVASLLDALCGCSDEGESSGSDIMSVIVA